MGVDVDEESLDAAFRALKRNESYQFELAEPIPAKPPSAFSKMIAAFFEGLFKILAPFLRIIFWLGIGALVLAVVYLLGRTIYETRFARPKTSDATDEPDIPLYQPAKAQAQILLDEIDRLAAEGRYGEAVHVLLFRSIQDIDRHRPNVVRRSLTAREIGQLTVLTPEARKAFSTIAGVSELSHFGGKPIGAAGFQTARAAYTNLTGGADAPRRRRR